MDRFRIYLLQQSFVYGLEEKIQSTVIGFYFYQIKN